MTQFGVVGAGDPTLDFAMRLQNPTLSAVALENAGCKDTATTATEASSTEPIVKKTPRSARSVKKPDTTNPKEAVNVAMSSLSAASTKKPPVRTRTISSILKDAEGSSTQTSERLSSRASSSRQSSAAINGAPRMTRRPTSKEQPAKVKSAAIKSRINCNRPSSASKIPCQGSAEEPFAALIRSISPTLKGKGPNKPVGKRSTRILSTKEEDVKLVDISKPVSRGNTRKGRTIKLSDLKNADKLLIQGRDKAEKVEDNVSDAHDLASAAQVSLPKVNVTFAAAVESGDDVGDTIKEVTVVADKGEDSHLVMAENTFQVYESYSTGATESVDHSKKITTWTTPEDVNAQWLPLAETEISALSPQAEILLSCDLNVREEKSSSFKVSDGDFVTVPLSPLNIQPRQRAGAAPPARSSELVEFILLPPWCPPQNPVEMKPATRQSKRLAKQKTGTGNGDIDKENSVKKSEYFPRSLRKLRASLDKVMGKDKAGRDKAGNSELTQSQAKGAVLKDIPTNLLRTRA